MKTNGLHLILPLELSTRPGPPQLYDFFSFHSNRPETRFSGAGGRPLFELAINLIVRGDVSVDGIITHRFPLAEVAQAYEAAHTRGHDCIRVAVEPE